MSRGETFLLPAGNGSSEKMATLPRSPHVGRRFFSPWATDRAKKSPGSPLLLSPSLTDTTRNRLATFEINRYRPTATGDS
ncbi:hypothetical protein B296_00042987 [Ensete ventricosum]|uniref:Uncharacterized protein n=1 Tax=Ensete ventricosum TaxID=4639 RepID=A0A426ZGH8_ENSVE|nr:hypothetical protein B296_00042987 [Ensete ventricosum]